MTSPPEALAIGAGALAAYDFWCASLGAREALDQAHTALAAVCIRSLGEGCATWPEPLRQRAMARMPTLISALETMLALEVPL